MILSFGYRWRWPVVPAHWYQIYSNYVACILHNTVRAFCQLALRITDDDDVVRSTALSAHELAQLILIIENEDGMSAVLLASGRERTLEYLNKSNVRVRRDSQRCRQIASPSVARSAEDLKQHYIEFRSQFTLDYDL